MPSLETGKFYLCKFIPHDINYVFKYLCEDKWSDGYTPAAVEFAIAHGMYEDFIGVGSNELEVLSEYTLGTSSLPPLKIQRKPIRCLNPV